jgi:hypothetical protein
MQTRRNFLKNVSALFVVPLWLHHKPGHDKGPPKSTTTTTTPSTITTTTSTTTTMPSTTTTVFGAGIYSDTYGDIY